MDEEIKAETQEIEVEDRVDEFAIDIFGVMGYDGRLPDSMVTIYNAFKKLKDRHMPGRISPEGFAMVIVMAEMLDDCLEYPDYKAIAAAKAKEAETAEKLRKKREQYG